MAAPALAGIIKALGNETSGADDSDNATWTKRLRDPGSLGPAPPSGHDVLVLQTTARGLELYVAPFLAVFGIVGNVLCLLCLTLSPCRPAGRSFATALIAAESIQLLVLLHEWATEMGLDLYFITGWCHLVMFVSGGAQFLSTWFLVSLLVSCFIFNGFPDREFCSPWRQQLVTVTLAIVALVVYLNISLTATFFYHAGKPICVQLLEARAATLYLHHADAFLNVLLPLVVNCVLGACLLLIKCCCIDRSSRGINTQLIGSQYILIHILFWIPFQVAHLYNSFAKLQTGLPHDSLRGFLWEQIFKYFYYLNMAANIGVLLLTNPLFKKQLHERLKQLCRVCNQRRDRLHYSGYSRGRLAHTSFIEETVPSDDD